MSFQEDLAKEVGEILKKKWETSDGTVIPEADSIALGNHAITINGTVLYADLVDSTNLVDNHKNWFAAEIYKSYLISACRIIRKNGGEITAFDGDRVMAVFIGGSKNTSAARTALEINWAVKNLINPAIKTQYPNTAFQIAHRVGIDTSDLFVARTGIRGSNDLVWVGRAANYAAKLSNLNMFGYPTIITQAVYNQMGDRSKYAGQPQQSMWIKDLWQEKGETIYKSSWWWEV